MALALVVTVPAGETELAADALWALGVVAIEERVPVGEVDDGTNEHMVELWTSLGEDVDAVTHAAVAFPTRWRWHLVDVDDAIVHTWRDHAHPTWVASDLVVCPAWVEFSAPEGSPDDLLVIDIEPGSTFGLGDHPTTVLSLRALRGVVWPGATVLDVGAGSGVLSVAAALLGAGRVEAIDISPASPAVVESNAEANGVGGKVEASTVPLAVVDSTYDIVLANILAPTLIELAEDLKRVLSPSGLLVISGVLVDRHAHVLEALAPLVPVSTATRDGWACVTLRR
jgi:ribosomal protein L11 methyltransferase